MTSISYSPKAQRAREVRAMRRLAQINGNAMPMTAQDICALAVFVIGIGAVCAYLFFAA
jgi:hypothetical protein